MTKLDMATASFGEKWKRMIPMVTIIPPPPIPAAFQREIVIANDTAPNNSIHSIGNTSLCVQYLFLHVS